MGGDVIGNEALLLAVILSEAPGAESKDPLKSESGEFGTFSDIRGVPRLVRRVHSLGMTTKGGARIQAGTTAVLKLPGLESFDGVGGNLSLAGEFLFG